jgi:hypothetical protein
VRIVCVPDDVAGCHGLMLRRVSSTWYGVGRYSPLRFLVGGRGLVC